MADIDRSLIGDLDPTKVPNPPFQPQPPAPPPAPAEDDTIVFTREQFDEFLRQQREESEANRRLMAEILHPQIPAQDQLPPVTINLDGLPDPRYDYDGYMKALGQRMSETTRQIEERARAAAQATVQQSQSVSSAVDAAWSMVREDHPELADHVELVDALTQKWANEQRAAGRDPGAMVMRDTAGVAREVGDYVMARIPDLTPAEDRDLPNRTGGIPSPRGQGPARKAPEPTSTFVDEVKDWQRKSGLF